MHICKPCNKHWLAFVQLECEILRKALAMGCDKVQAMYLQMASVRSLPGLVKHDVGTMQYFLGLGKDSNLTCCVYSKPTPELRVCELA